MFNFYNFIFESQLNSFMNGLIQFNLMDYLFKFNFFHLKITILYHDSSKYENTINTILSNV